MPADAPTPEAARELAAIEATLAGHPVGPEHADLALLVRDLCDERPEIAPSFAADLDRRAAAGFANEPGRFARWRARRPTVMPALAFAACALLVAVVSVSALDGRPGEDAATAPAGAGMAAQRAEGDDELRQFQREESQDTAAGSAAPVAPAGGDVAVPPLPQPGDPRSDGRGNRRVERSASLTLAATPARLERVADEIVEVTDRLGGFVVTSSVSSGADGPSGGSFELRVPSRRLPQAVADLSRLAHVRERRQATQDITAPTVSARERLRNARADRRGVLKRLEEADTEEEAAALRARLRYLSRRIAAARTDLARLDNRARFATVSVQLVADRSTAAEEDEDGVWSPADAARDALRVLEVIAGVALVALAVLLPLALLAVLGLAAGRLAARRRRDRALDGA